MSWSICWALQKLLQQPISVMPSTSLRLLQKTCGLFDTGFAGSASDAASLGVKAPAPGTLSAGDQFLYELDLDQPDSFLGTDINNSFEDLLSSSVPSHGNMAVFGSQQHLKTNLIQPVTAAVDTEPWDMLGDSFEGLESDQLADNSLDAFINLDQLLSKDDFLNEVAEVEPVIDMKPTVLPDPVISIPTPEIITNKTFDFFDLLDDEMQIEDASILLNSIGSFSDQSKNSTVFTSATFPQEFVTAATSGSKVSNRKRKSTSKVQSRPCKTSLFEIPPISENEVTSSTNEAAHSSLTIYPNSPVFDHDYTTKQAYPVATLTFDNDMQLTEVTAVEPGPSTSTQVKIKPVKDKQTIRRQKNNLASKRSREQRKQKFSELDVEAEELIQKNEVLRREIVQLEKMAKDMKAALVAKMTGK